MEVQLYDSYNNQNVSGLILKTTSRNLPTKRSNWQFNWKSLNNVEGAEFYKIVLSDSPETIQGLLMLSLMYDELVYMHNIEVAQHNLGGEGRYDHVAGTLISFACLQAFDRGKDKYKGFLAFTSKTKLIDFYCKKYGATHAMGHQMYIDRKAGSDLINKYLYQDDKF